MSGSPGAAASRNLFLTSLNGKQTIRHNKSQNCLEEQFWDYFFLNPLMPQTLFLILRKYMKSNLFMRKIRNFLCFFICSFLLNCPTAEVRPVAGGARFVYLNYLHRIIQQPKMNKSLANAKKPFLDGYQNASEITSRRIFYYVRT